MNKTEMLQALEAAVPSLQGKLHIERVLYKKATNKAYMSFLCDELVRENDFLQVERTLKELFPQVNVALRIASPGLGEDFLSHLDKYQSVLTDFLRRQSPALLAWLDDVGWSMENGRILLTCPDSISMQYFSSHQLDKRVAQCIYDIFRVKVTVGLTVCGEREAWTKKMREERGFSFSPALAGSFDGSGASGSMEEPPPWDDAALDAQAAAMEIPGAAPVASAPAPKPKPKAAPAPKPAYTPPPKPDSRYPVLKGRAIGDKPVDIVELAEDSGIVVIEGTVTGVNEPKELKGGETVLVTFAVYDLTSTIYCKAFYQYRMKRRGMGEEPVPPTDEERQRVKEQVDQIKNGMRVRLRGECRMDTFLGELSIGVRDMQQMPSWWPPRPGGAIPPWPLRITAPPRRSRRPLARPRKTTLSSFPAWRAIWWIWCLSSRTRTTGSFPAPLWCWTSRPPAFPRFTTASSRWARSSWWTARSWTSSASCATRACR